LKANGIIISFKKAIWGEIVDYVFRLEDESELFEKFC